MSLKLAVVSALIVATSCAHFEYFDQQQHRRQHEQHAIQVQNEQIREQNEKIRQHYQDESFHRQEQMRQLEEQRRIQEQINRGHYHGQFNNYQNYYPFAYAHYPNRHFDNRNTFVARNFDNSNYNLDYAVADMKSHQESRYGDNVEGRYSPMVDSDGVVDYCGNGEGLETKVMRVPANFQGENFSNHYRQPFNFQPKVYSSTQVHQESDNARSDYATSMASNF